MGAFSVALEAKAEQQNKVTQKLTSCTEVCFKQQQAEGQGCGAAGDISLPLSSCMVLFLHFPTMLNENQNSTMSR